MISLSIPNLSGNEWQYIKDCLDSTWVSSVGSYVNLFEKKVAEFCGVNYAVATSNGTAALHISLLLAGVKSKDLVILPNITFVAPANAIKYTGADPLLIDVDRKTWQMDVDLLSRFLDEHAALVNNECIHRETGRRISTIVPVHVVGNICDMDKLVSLAKKWNLVIVEDSTEALGSYYKDKHAGSIGLFGCLSFNGNKIITTGGGGMILCNDETLAKRAKHLTTQAKADPDEYYHDEVGYNYRLVNILAAMGVAQMEQLPGFLERKKVITEKYNRVFEKIPGCFFQKITEGVNQNNWLYTIGVPKQKELRAHFKKNKIDVRPFWIPMNQLPAFREAIYYNDNNVSEQIYSNCLSIPCSTGLTDNEQDQVINCINEFYNG